MIELDFEKDINIDPDNLDIEWMEQPELVYKYSKAVAESEDELSIAKLDMDMTKNELEKVRASTELHIRANPEHYGLAKKPTEASVKSAIALEKEVLDTQKEYYDTIKKLNKAKDIVNTFRSALKAIEAKRPALENLVKLLLSNYYSGPIEPRNIKEKIAEKEERNKKIVEDKIMEVKKRKQKKRKRN